MRVSTQIIDKDEVYSLKDKTIYNEKNCALIHDLIKDRSHVYKILILDAADLGTSNKLIEMGVFEPSIDLVSRGVKFIPHGPHGLFYTGELSDFIELYGNSRVYDAMVLDFCCTWNNEIASTIDAILKSEMLCDESVVSFTFCGRVKTRESQYRHFNKLQTQHDLYMLFYRRGYMIRWTMEHEDGVMYSLYGKCIHLKKALSYSRNYKAGQDPSNWLNREVIQKKKKMKRIHQWTCVRGHDLEMGFRLKDPIWSCDNCNENYHKDEEHLRCEKCDYDLCQECN
jgi:hypothetical protein